MRLNARLMNLSKRIKEHRSAIRLYFIEREGDTFIFGDRRMNRQEFDAWQAALTGDRIIIVDDYGDDE